MLTSGLDSNQQPTLEKHTPVMNSSPSRAEEIQALGLSELHIEVISGQKRRVRTILKSVDSEDRRKLIEIRDADSTTPLMAAALTGRLSIAKFLLRKGASSKAKDYRGRRALQYASARRFANKLDAYQRLGLTTVSQEQRRKRLEIAKILRYPAALRSSRRVGRDEYSDVVFCKIGEDLVVLKSETTFKFKTGNRSLKKAASGFITSATTPTEKVAATSGWKANQARGLNVLDNAKYTRLVRDVAKFLNFQITGNQRDASRKHGPEDNGLFHACHVEKKLAVFWTIASLKIALNTTDFRRLRDLRDSPVPEAAREAKIYLDHDPCQDLTTSWPKPWKPWESELHGLVEVQLPRMDPQLRAEYDRVSETSGARHHVRPRTRPPSTNQDKIRKSKKQQRDRLQQVIHASNDDAKGVSRA
ncbi:hypothetical protein VTK56DRAFT_7936 [Thermocarpiscus australiensis]